MLPVQVVFLEQSIAVLHHLHSSIALVLRQSTFATGWPCMYVRSALSAENGSFHLTDKTTKCCIKRYLRRCPRRYLRRHLKRYLKRYLFTAWKEWMLGRLRGVKSSKTSACINRSTRGHITTSCWYNITCSSGNYSLY